MNYRKKQISESFFLYVLILLILFVFLMSPVKNKNINSIPSNDILVYPPFQKTILLDNSIMVLRLENQVNPIEWTELNLTQYVSNTTIIVYLRLIISDYTGYPTCLLLRTNDSTLGHTQMIMSHNPNENYYLTIIMKVDSNKTIQYSLKNNVVNSFIQIKVFGYIEEKEW